MIYRQWKRDALVHPLPLDNVVSRLRTHGIGTDGKSPATIEAGLMRGMVFETPCARFALHLSALTKPATGGIA